MHPLLKKHFPLIAMGTLCIVMALLLWLAILPLRGSIREKMDDIQKFYTSRENRDRQIAKLPDLSKQFEAIMADEGALDILLQEEHIVDFIKTLERLAGETGVTIEISSKENGSIIDAKKSPAKQTSVKKGTETDENVEKDESILGNLPFDRYLSLGISVSGEYADIVRFLHRMETLPFGLDVVGVDMRQESEEGSGRALSGSGINPFLLTPTGENAVPAEKILTEEKKDLLKATFDTIVYVEKKE